MSNGLERSADPAMRLHQILQRMLVASRYQTTIRAVVAVTLANKGSDLPNARITDYELYRHLAEIIALFDEFENARVFIQASIPNTVVKPVLVLSSRILGITSDSEKGTLIRDINAALPVLKLCSSHLQKHRVERPIPEDCLSAIEDELNALVALVKRADALPAKLRLVLYDLIESALRSIKEYSMRGPKGLRNEIFLLLTKIEDNYDLLAKHKKKPEVEGFMAFLTKLDKITAAAIKTKELLNRAAPLIPLLRNAAHAIEKTI